MKKKKQMTTAELKAKLKRDPNYQKFLHDKELQWKEADRKSSIEQKQLILDIKKSGIKVSSIWDLVNTNATYKNTIPVLINHLSKSYCDATKQGIIRALAVKEAKGIAGKVLLEEFYKIPKENYDLRWAIGNTMTMVITEKEVDEVIKIVIDKSNGKYRSIFVEALSKFKTEKVIRVLTSLMDDKEISLRVAKVLKRIIHK
jgi:hypothetical protein